MNEVVLPLVVRSTLPKAMKDKLMQLIHLHHEPNFTDIYVCVREYRHTDPVPPKASGYLSIYSKIVSIPKVSGATVPIDWRPVSDLRSCYQKAFKERGIHIESYDLLVDVPYGKTPHRMIYVRNPAGGEDIPITEVSHLEKQIFEEPAAFLSPVRVYVSPDIYEQGRQYIETIAQQAEDFFYKSPS